MRDSLALVCCLIILGCIRSEEPSRNPSSEPSTASYAVALGHGDLFLSDLTRVSLKSASPALKERTLAVLEKAVQRRELTATERMLRRKLSGADARIGRSVLALQTTNSGGTYRQECEDAGVPVPPMVLDSSWDHIGTLNVNFAAPGFRSELWLYESTDPDGMCLALPRHDDGNGGDIDPFGVICMGRQTGKVCFWDNPNGQSFPEGVPVDIADFVGGFDLEANGQGVCSDCHAGENPYVVHWGDPAFDALRGMSVDRFPSVWHDPMVHPAWPENPGPLPGLPAPPMGQDRCDRCHNQNGSGRRFPQPSRRLVGWCFTVLERSLTAGTMPPGSGDFSEHIAWLSTACRSDPPSTAGTTVDWDFPQTINTISQPIIDEPIYNCAETIQVRGVTKGAVLRVYVNGTYDGMVTVTDSERVVYAPTVALGPMNTIEVVHQVGSLSASDTAQVRDHTIDYPMGLPPPAFVPHKTHECANSVAVTHLIGAKILAERTGSVTRSRTVGGQGDYTWFTMGPDFMTSDSLEVRQELCSGTASDPSPVLNPSPAPSLMPAPWINTPFIGQTEVRLHGIVEGAGFEVEETAVVGGLVASYSSWPTSSKLLDVERALGVPVQAGFRFDARQSLCGVDSIPPPEDPPPPYPCDQLPAPEIAVPQAGDEVVIVTRSEPGAVIIVVDQGTGSVIGIGPGYYIGVNPALYAGQPLIVLQRVGTCEGRRAFQIDVVPPNGGGGGNDDG